MTFKTSIDKKPLSSVSFLMIILCLSNQYLIDVLEKQFIDFQIFLDDN